MPKIFYSIIFGGFVLAALTVVNIGMVNASEDTKFVQVPVLARSQADYGVDENVTVIPVVSAEIIKNKVYDMQHSVSDTVKTIKYTTLPVKNSGSGGEHSNQAQSVEQPEPKKDHTNKGPAVTNQNQNPNQNQSQNQNSNQNGNGKNKDKSTGKGNSTSQGNSTSTGNSGGSDTVKTNNKGGTSASQVK